MSARAVIWNQMVADFLTQDREEGAPPLKKPINQWVQSEHIRTLKEPYQGTFYVEADKPETTSQEGSVSPQLITTYLSLTERDELAKVYPGAIQRLQRYRSLERNWDSYGGLPPSEDTIDWALETLDEMRKAADDLGTALPEPYVVPGPEGSIQFEWEIGEKEFELELIISEGLPKCAYLLCPESDDSTWQEGEFTGPVLDHRAVATFLYWL